MPIDQTTASQANGIVKAAQSLPELISGIEAIDPDLAKQMAGQNNLVGTPVYTLIAAGVAWVSTKYGLGWDTQATALVSGAVILVGGYVFHWLSTLKLRSLTTAAAKASSTS